MSVRSPKPILVVLLSGAFSTIAAAALGPRYGGELAVGVPDLPVSLQPGVPRGTGARLAAGLVHETLIGLGPSGLQPKLAESWSAAAGSREWTLQLREGMRFHDAAPITSEDAVRWLRRFLRSASPAAEQLAASLDGGTAFRSRATESLPGLTSAGSLGLVLRLSEAWANPLAPLAASAAAVMSVRGAGAGPFVPTLSVPGRGLTLTTFAGHVRGRPYLDRIQLRVIPEAEALRWELQAGTIDVAWGEGGPSALSATLLLVLDPSRSPFDQAEARTAVRAAIDSSDLVKHLIPGGEPSPSLLVPSLLPPLGERAVSSGEKLAGSASLVVSREVPPVVSQRVVAYLSLLGLRLEVRPVSPSDALAADGHARLLIWSPEVSEAGLALAELSALAPRVPEAEAAMAAARREPDPERRRDHLLRAEAALQSMGVLIPLASFPVSFAARPGIQGLAVDLAGRLVLEDAWLEP